MANVYKHTRRKQQRTKRHRLTLAVGILAVIVGMMLFGGLARDRKPDSPSPHFSSVDGLQTRVDERSASEPAVPGVGASLDAGAARQDSAAANNDSGEAEAAQCSLLQGVIKRGQTIGNVLGEYVSPQELRELVSQCEAIFSLSRLTAGHAYAIATDGQEFKGFAYEVSRSERLNIQKLETGYDISLSTVHYDVELKRVSGTISSSLFEAIGATGEGDELAVRLANIFEYDIDFLKDLRGGDSFSLLVEKRSTGGQPAGYGRILAAEFVNQGDTYRAFLRDEGDGATYFDAKGRALRKGFLKAPLEFRRISSNFTMRRLHPVLGIVRPHPGIDYAAPVGTPVRTVADGVVTACTRDNAAGNYVKIRHAGGYETTYMHMSRFGRGMAVGRNLRQGEVLGYVGATGYATGPHLDFRVKLGGNYINPTTVKAMASQTIPSREMAAYQDLVRQLTAELEAEEALSSDHANAQAGQPGG